MLKRHISISLRLTTLFGAIFVLGWVLFGTAMWLNLKTTLKRERRQTLSRRIDRLEDLLRKNQAESDADRYQDFADFARATGNGLVEVFGSDGRRLYPSPSSAAKAFPWPDTANLNTERLVHTESAGQPYWVFVRPFSLENRPVYLLDAAPEAGNVLIIQSFWKGLLASAPILLIIASACGYWMSRRALQPVDRITAAARSISIRNLSERIPVSRTGDELERLADTCNAMLNRLESAVNQIKRFTADASHELRGPLSFTRTVAEVALRNPHIDPESRQAFEDIVDEVATASVLLEEMLVLARADSEASGITFEPVDLGAVVVDVYETARPLAAEKKLHMTIGGDGLPLAHVLGDFSSLRRLLWIVLDNALKYTDPLGTIEVSLTTDFECATLLVTDSGCGISAEDLPYIFDRFYRADPSRSQVEGNGLGLAIAKWIAEIHHAEVSVTSERNEGTTFRMIFRLYESAMLNT